MEYFTWRPAEPLNTVALQRLKRYTLKPKTPLGEAWFMGEERKLFPELLGDFDSVDNAILYEALGEIITGTRSFDQMEEWQAWFAYILAHSIENGLIIPSFEPLQTLLISGLIVHHPDAILLGHYPKYADDILETLGKNVMRRFYFLPHDPMPYLPQSWDFTIACGEVSANLSFCAKYLPTDTIPQWFTSVLDIKNPVWQVLVMNWLSGFYELLLTGEWIGKTLDEIYPYNITWEYSHCITRGLSANHSDFIAKDKRDAILRTCDNYFSRNDFNYWIKDFGNLELGYSGYEIQPLIIIESFRENYINRKNRTLILE